MSIDFPLHGKVAPVKARLAVLSFSLKLHNEDAAKRRLRRCLAAWLDQANARQAQARWKNGKKLALQAPDAVDFRSGMILEAEYPRSPAAGCLPWIAPPRVLAQQCLPILPRPATFGRNQQEGDD